MVQAARVVLIIFSMLLIAGGIGGYRAGSTVSLIMGVICGMIGGLAFAWSYTAPSAGLTVGLAVAIVVGLSFVERYLKTHAFMPAGLTLVLSVVTIIVLSLAIQSLRASR